MTLNQITYFKTIARHLNYHAAAEELYVSQPSLSRSMSALEKELNIELFEKHGRGIELTKAGHLFLEYANKITEDVNIVNYKMKQLATDGGKIEIGYVFPLAGHYIPSCARNFLNKEENSKIFFNFWQNHTPAIEAKVMSGELDVGFGGYISNESIEKYPIFEEEFVIITPLDHPLSQFDEVDFSELNNYPIISYDKESWMGIHLKPLYKMYGVKPNIIIECSDEYSMVALVAENFGIALCPDTDLLRTYDNVAVHKIRNKVIVHQIFMFWLKDHYHIPAVERFIAYMKTKKQLKTDNKNASKIYLKDIINY